MATEAAAIDADLAASAADSTCHRFARSLKDWILQNAGSVDPTTNQPVHADVSCFLEGKFNTAEKMAKHAQDLRDLEKKCLKLIRAKAAVQKEAYTTTAPQDPETTGIESELERFSLRLWQLPMNRELSMKGASTAKAILDTAVLFMTKGSRTEKFPLEVLFRMPGSPGIAAGQSITDFSLGVANGFCAVTAKHLICCAAVELGWLSDHSAADTQVAWKVLRCLRVTGTHDPQPDAYQAARATLASKIQASSRTRPNIIQMRCLSWPQ